MDRLDSDDDVVLDGGDGSFSGMVVGTGAAVVVVVAVAVISPLFRG